jgi:biotin carboxyl carrier protein
METRGPHGDDAMKYRVQTPQGEKWLEVTRTNDVWRYQLGEASGEVSVRKLPPGVLLLEKDGHQITAHASAGVEMDTVQLGAERIDLRVVDPREWSGESAGQGGSGRQQVKSSMPGRVVRLLVAVGEHVEAGGGVIVVEAMKMQNELRARHAGVVAAIHVEESATVAAGTLLVTLE